jgi:general stress protein 26
MKEKNLENKSEHVKKLRELIEKIQFSMFTTVDEKGQLRSRPMATQKMDENGDLWFFTSVNSAKVEEVQVTHQVNLVYSSGENNFVSVSGEAQLVRDKNKAKELWTPILKAWFPDGLESPDLGLIRVKPLSAEYWDIVSNKVVQLFGLAKAVLTGKPHEGEGTEHHKVDIA